MFISVLLSFAAPTVWVLMIMEKNEYQARIARIDEKQDEIQKRFERLDRYESDLTRLVGTMKGMDEGKINKERMEQIRQKAVAGHPLLQDKDMSVSELLLAISWQVRNEARQLRPLRLQQQRVQQYLQVQQNRFNRYETTFDGLTSMLTSHKNRLTTRRGELKTQAQEVKTRGEETVSNIESEMSSARQEHTRVIEKLDREIRSIKSDIASLRQQKVNVTVQQKPDGRILRSSSTTGWAHINKGSEDDVKAGIQFRVYGKGKRDERIEKGMIEVKQVYSDYARCKILSPDAVQQPILKNDLILNPMFDSKERITYAMAGRFSNRGRQKMLIEKAGAEVRESVDVEVDYLIVSGNYEDDPKFKKARTLGIPLIKFQNLTPFLGE